MATLTLTSVSTSWNLCVSPRLLLVSHFGYFHHFLFSDNEATWCPPCKQIKPIYHDLSTTTESVAFGLVDVDDNNEAAVEFQISAVPTFVFSQGEATMERLAGADPNKLQQNLAALKDA